MEVNWQLNCPESVTLIVCGINYSKKGENISFSTTIRDISVIDGAMSTFSALLALITHAAIELIVFRHSKPSALTLLYF